MTKKPGPSSARAAERLHKLGENRRKTFAHVASPAGFHGAIPLLPDNCLDAQTVQELLDAALLLLIEEQGGDGLFDIV